MAWSATRFNLAKGGEARYAEGLYVTGTFYQVLGVPAIIGRTFTAEDDKPDFRPRRRPKRGSGSGSSAAIHRSLTKP